MYRTFNSKWSVLLVLLLSLSSGVRADDGMWLLALLKKYNAGELRDLGLKIPLEQLSGENEGALSEAVVAFGSGCTGSVISGSGLVLTNYHCSYGAIQQYISESNDIFKKGYWAATPGGELPVSGLSVTINKKILDITGEVMGLLKKDATHTTNVREATAAVIEKYKQKYPKYNVVVKPYKNNSIFVLFLQVKYNDIRLVGVPPTDNWMWPRQSADFAFFRVYADKNGAPAAFSNANVPLTVKTYLHISKEGYKKGDFAMSMGYPMQSDRDATSMQIREKIGALNIPTIAVRKTRQSILEEEMNKSLLVKQMYAEKYATSANYYKNAVGMNFWVDKLNVISKKEVYEKEWMQWIGKDEGKRNIYATTLMDLKKELEANEKFKRAQTYYSECFNIACDIIQFVAGFDNAFKTYVTDIKSRPSLYRDFSSNVNQYYRRLNTDVDRRITKELLKLLNDSLTADLLPGIFSSKDLHSNARIDQYVDEVFRTSIFCDSAKLKSWLKDPAFPIENDPGFQLAESISHKQMEIFRTTQSNAGRANKIVVSYYKSLSDYKDSRYYPDADKTIRLSYGTVSDLQLEGKTVPYQTTLSSLVAKADPLNKDFGLNKKLEAIWQNKDYGSYAVNGDLPVCFITNGDVTGGNSGSPMMNGEGKIIGLVFDCNWESMTREFNYEPNLHKVICVDVRYLLLVTEKFSGTDRIINEIDKANQWQVAGLAGRKKAGE
jgi:hypothetical protein